MSKELIEKLRAFAPYASPNAADLMHEAADALEAKAAPVGELREAFEAKYPAAKKLEFRGGVYLNRLGSELPRSVRDGINDAWVDFQAGAAHQRQQAREVVMPDDLSELLTEIVDIHRRRGVVLTIHIEQIADMLARLNKGAGSHEQ